MVSATTFAPSAAARRAGWGDGGRGVPSEIDVGWQDVAGESGYTVQRSANGVNGWTEVDAAEADVVSFSDTGLAASTTYYYRVLASNASGDSAPSAVVVRPPMPVPHRRRPAGVAAAVSASESMWVGRMWLGVRVHGAAVGQWVTGWTQVGARGAMWCRSPTPGLTASTSYGIGCLRSTPAVLGAVGGGERDYGAAGAGWGGGGGGVVLADRCGLAGVAGESGYGWSGRPMG